MEYKIILGSNSPRRKAFLKELGFDFTVRTAEIEEIYPLTLKAAQISEYLAVLKAKPLVDELKSNELLLTSDTLVWHNDIALGKPKDEAEAKAILRSLSGDTHHVYSSVCFTTTEKQLVKTVETKVTFRELTDTEINYYVANFKPFDKAGAYGIQEWIGLIGIEKIEGSYTSVVGLPTQVVYNTLLEFC